MCLFLCFVSALTGAGKSFTFGLARIFRTTVSFLSTQFRQMWKCLSKVNLRHYLLSGDQFKIQTSFGQFSFKIFLHNHCSTERTNLLFRSTQEERTILVDQSGTDSFRHSIQGLPNVILDTSCKSRHSSFFGAKRKWKPFKRDKSTSHDFIARSDEAIFYPG